MKKFVVILSSEKVDSLSKDLLNAHVMHLRSLYKKGVLFICGPLKDKKEGFLIIQAETYEEAENYILLDPFIKEKYYSQYTISELIEANEDNNYLDWLE